MRTAAVLTLLLILAASPVLASKGSDGEGTLAVVGADDGCRHAGCARPDHRGTAHRAQVPRPALSEPRPVDESSVGLPPRVVVSLPANPPRVVSPQGGRTADREAAGSSGIRGVASWYCGPNSRCTRGYPGGLYAAAGPALRRLLADWRGRVVRVTGPSGSITVTIIDCNCGPNANLIDLYSDAFRRLAPLSRGLLKVTVSWN